MAPRSARRAVLGAALALLLALLSTAQGVDAHALPVQMTPKSGAVVAQPPREVVITFSERLEPGFSSIEVRDANGTLASRASSVDASGATMRAALSADLAYGTYTVAWKALSASDGHSTRGLASFLFPDPSKPLTARDLGNQPAESQEALVGPQDAALRAIVFTTAFLLLGATVLLLLVAGPDAPPGPWPAERQLARIALAAGLVGAVATLALAASQASAATGLNFLQAFTSAKALGAGRYGQMALLRAPLLGVAGVLAGIAPRLARQRRAAWAVSGLVTVAAFTTLSLSSHAAALQTWTLPAMVADAVHLAAAAAWIGGLVGLGWVLLRPPAELKSWPQVAGRFSALATLCVGLVVLTGVAAAVLQLHSVGDLVGSLYGQALLVKLALVAGVLALGARNRFKLLPHAGTPAGLDRFGRSVRAEAVLGVAVLVAAGILTALSPPVPVIATAPPPVFQVSQIQDGLNATLIVSPAPPQVGLGVFDIFINRADGLADTNATRATLTFLPPDRSLGQDEIAMDHPHPGHFAAEGSYFTLPGHWTVRALVQRANEYDLVVSFDVDVAGASP